MSTFESEIGQEIARVPPSTPAHGPLHIPTTLPLFPLLPFELKLTVFEYATSDWLGTPATHILNFTCCEAVENPSEYGSISYMEGQEPWAALRIFHPRYDKTGLNHWSPFETCSLFRKVAVKAVKAMEWHGVVVGGRGLHQYQSIFRFRRYYAQKGPKRVRAVCLIEDERVEIRFRLGEGFVLKVVKR